MNQRLAIFLTMFGPDPGSAVALWLARSPPDRAAWVRVLAENIMLRSWAIYFTLTVPLCINEYRQIQSFG